MDAMQHVFNEILMEDSARFEGTSLEEVTNYIEKRYEEKYKEMEAEGTATETDSDPTIWNKPSEKHGEF